MTTNPRLAGVPGIELLDHDLLTGAATGPLAASDALLLLHGLGDDRNQMRFLHDQLCRDSGRSLLPRLRGDGARPTPPWGYSPLDYAADLHRLTDCLPVPFDVVGFSYGALVALVYAAVMGPSRVRRLVLLDQSFERRPSRIEGGEWAESSFLKWDYDYTHLIGMLAAAGVPVLLVVALDSPVVPSEERARLRRLVSPLLRIVTVEGKHTDVVRPDSRVPHLVAEFLRSHVPGSDH